MAGIKTDVNYRHINPHELDALLELNRHLHVTDAPLPDAGTVQKVWRETLSDPKMHCLVGETDGKVVASCILMVVPNLTRGTRSYALIENVVTHADYRQKGVGSGLLKYAMHVAWDAGCYKVMLMTGRQRDEVFRFYEKAGFRRGGKTAFEARYDDLK
jgi:GNAT superfamily N-acetyltransferase